MIRRLALTAAACLLVTAACGDKKKDASALDERFTVAMVDLKDVIAQTGEVRSTVKVDLKCEASGIVKKLLVKEGQKVSKGQKLLVIDPEQIETRKKSLDLSVDQARINMEKAQRDYNHGIELVKTGTVSQIQVEDLKSDLEQKIIVYKQQQLDLDDIVDQLSKTVVVAPMEGVLTALNIDEGEIAVSATGGFSNPTDIGTISDVRRLEVVTQIGEVDYVNLSIGQKVTIKPEAREGAQTRGTITFISLTAKKETGSELGSFQVLVSVDSLIVGIAPGINVNVEFVVLQKNGVLGVPYHYVKTEEGKSTILVSAKGANGKEKLDSREIKVGATDYKNYEVLSGLQKGDEVVFQAESDEQSAADKKKANAAKNGSAAAARKR